MRAPNARDGRRLAGTRAYRTRGEAHPRVAGIALRRLSRERRVDGTGTRHDRSRQVGIRHPLTGSAARHQLTASAKRSVHSSRCRGLVSRTQRLPLVITAGDEPRPSRWRGARSRRTPNPPRVLQPSVVVTGAQGGVGAGSTSVDDVFGGHQRPTGPTPVSPTTPQSAPPNVTGRYSVRVLSHGGRPGWAAEG
jgi:hypothetical protein